MVDSVEQLLLIMPGKDNLSIQLQPTPDNAKDIAQEIVQDMEWRIINANAHMHADYA